VALTTIACFTPACVRFSTVPLCRSWLNRLALAVSVTVNTVSLVLVGVPATTVQKPPHPAAAAQDGTPLATVSTCEAVPIGSLVNNHQAFL